MRVLVPLLAWPLMLPACGGNSGGSAAGVGDAGRDATASSGDSGAEGGYDATASNGDSGAEGGHDATTSDGGTGDGTTGDDGSSDATTDASPEASAPPVGASVLMYHSHINRDGYFQDPLMTAASAAKVAYDPTFKATLPDAVWASPLYVENGVGGHGTFYVATAGNNVFALDETTGGRWWTHNYGSPATESYEGGCGNVHPIGITGTPAIDLATRLMVFDAVTGDGTPGNYIRTHTLYGVSIDDGSTRWSVDVSTLKDPTGLAFSPQAQNERAAVLIVNGRAYVAYGGHGGDCGDYHGWVVGVALDGTDARAWATQVRGGGIWGPGGPASDGQSIFVTTGNGILDQATWQESEGLFRLDPGPSFTGATTDYFALNNWSPLDTQDMDLSGSGPLVIDAPSITPSALVLGQGKDGWLYLVDRSNLGGITAAKDTANVGAINAANANIAQGGAWATVGGTTYIVVRSGGGEGVGCPDGGVGDLIVVKLDPTAPQKMTVAWCAYSFGNGSPIITTSDGAHDGLVWAYGAENYNQLHAFDLATGAIVGTSGEPPLAANAIVHHFSTPAEVKGRIFVVADQALFAFKVGP